jgi:sugar-phosphatase
VRNCFVAVVGVDNVTRTKPDPEPYLETLTRLRVKTPDLEAADCVVVEDTPPGIAAGRAAGMIVVGVAQTYPAAALSAADHVLPSLRRVTAASLRALVEKGEAGA